MLRHNTTYISTSIELHYQSLVIHDNVIKWKNFPRYCPFVWGIHRSPVNSPNKGQWRGALMFSLICAWINGWVNNREAGDLSCHRAHYDVTVMRSGVNTGSKQSRVKTILFRCRSCHRDFCWIIIFIIILSSQHYIVSHIEQLLCIAISVFLQPHTLCKMTVPDLQNNIYACNPTHL